jgi:hypothetical protein
MLIGKDFDKIHITFFNLDICEPNVLITDTLMASVCLYFAYRLLAYRKQSDFHRFWFLFFLIYGISSFAGGLGHGLYTYFGPWGKLFTWTTGIYSIYLIEKAMISLVNDQEIRRRYAFFSLIKLIFVYLVFTYILLFLPIYKKPGLPFLPIAINTIVGVILSAGILGYKFSKKIQPEMKYLYQGVLVMLPSALFFLGKINIHPWFDKNDASHLFLTVGLFLFFKGVRAVQFSASYH